MPFDPQTGIYTSALAKVALPDRALSIYEFLFENDKPYSAASDALARPDPAGRTWLIDANSPRTLTFEQARARTDDLARAFDSKGLTEGKTVLVFSPNDVDYELAYQIQTVDKHYPVALILVHPNSVETTVKACEIAGFSTELLVLIRPPGESPANTKSRASGFPTIDDLISSTRNKPLPPKVSIKPDEARTRLALLSFSSGTTGVPKAVMIPHFAVIANVYHIYGLVVILHQSVYQNTPIVIHPRFDQRAFLQSIQDHRITSLYLVPPQVIFMVKQDALVKQFDLSSVRMVMAGAAPLTNDTVSAFRRLFPHISIGQGYGMTESSTIISTMDGSFDFPGASAGLLVPNIEAKIVSPEGKALPPGEVGELWSRGPSNALGYLNNEQATKETFDADGFLHTGDEAYLKADGMLFITDRIKELIKVSGFQVAPAELEGHLLSHEDVLDVCVIGIPDERKGEAPKAYVVPSPAAASRLQSGGSRAEQELVASIMKFVADHKIRYKHLVEVEFIDAIPKNPSGKLLRKDLRTRHAQKSKKEVQKL
ncbi:hypothetical protein JCM10449v2_001957 [Rhodotorula kratochvilovae]